MIEIDYLCELGKNERIQDNSQKKKKSFKHATELQCKG